MLKAWKQFGLPLLVKELLEQAAQRRTYIIRVVYAALFFLASLAIILPEMARSGNSVFNMLGIGQKIFQAVIGCQFAGIYLFLPPIACSVLTTEKERNTLGLLFLTKLSPWTILWEKLIGRLFPMICLMLCSLPLLAFAISFGGLNSYDILMGIALLLLTAFQVAATALASSAFFRTTTAALLGCHVLMFLTNVGVPVFDWLVLGNALHNYFELMCYRWLEASAGPGGTFSLSTINTSAIMLSGCGAAQFVSRVSAGQQGLVLFESVRFNLMLMTPLVVSCLIPLGIARFFLVRRAFVPANNLVLNFLRVIDRWFHALNDNRVTKGITLWDDRHSVPGSSPIAWRETHKRSLGQTHYLIRVLLALEVPVLLIIMTTIFRSVNDYYGSGSTVSWLTSLVWLTVALLVTTTSSAVFAGERSRQTLDILLTLPMTGRQIILDKVTGVRRLVWICAIPLVTCICFEAWWRDVIGARQYSHAQENYVLLIYLLTALSLVATYLPLLTWLSVWIGLRTRSATRATLTTLIVIVAWCVLPVVTVLIVWTTWMHSRGVYNLEAAGYGMLLLFSPLGLLSQSEFASLSAWSTIPLLPMFLNLLLYGSCCLILRWWVLSNADRLLGRSKSGHGSIVKIITLPTPSTLTRVPSFVE